MKIKLSDNFSRLARFVRKYRVGMLISVAVCAISVGLYVALQLASHSNPVLSFLNTIELRTLDARFQLRGPRPPRQEIVIVAIDQKSQDVLGRWPFPRSNLAQLIDVMREAQARVIAFDANFPQPDQNSALKTLADVRKRYEASARSGTLNRVFERYLEELEADADNDKKFAQAISRFKNVILGYFFLTKEETQSQDRKRVEEFIDYLSYQAYSSVNDPSHSARLFTGPEFESLYPNLPDFALWAKNFGFYNVIPEPDGVVRRELAIIKFREAFYPSLDIAAYLAYTDLDLGTVEVQFNPTGLRSIKAGPLIIPTDAQGFVQIDYYGYAGSFPTYSFCDVIQHKTSAETFRDKLVLVGPTATGIADMAVTPYRTQTSSFPGVEVHANFISNLLQGHFVRRDGLVVGIDIGFILLFSLAAGVLLSVVPSVRATVIVIVSLGCFLWLSFYLFASRSIWITTFLPFATLTVNYALIVSYRFFIEEREKKRVTGAFQQYVAPSIIHQLLENPELLQLGGEEKVLTAMFTDIKNFTGISEGMSPHDLVELLNEHLTEMTELIFQHWGTLDKYIGDSIMAYWGAPFPQPDHAERACKAALAMLKALNISQERWKAQGKPCLDIRVGINTGPMLVGNMGSRHRFNFTVMGDNVNLASRLEGLNKQFGTRLIISETTCQLVQQKMLVRELDLIRVQGKTRPVKIYELLGLLEESGPWREFVPRFHNALEAYRSARWETSIGMFGELLREQPDDGPTRVLIQRCMDLIESPPEGEWDGVFVMKTK